MDFRPRSYGATNANKARRNPNEADREDAKKRGEPPGGFIMVHGQKNGLGWLAFIAQQFNWTNGCIVLTNPEMDEFMELVSVGTPIQIHW